MELTTREIGLLLEYGYASLRATEPANAGSTAPQPVSLTRHCPAVGKSESDGARCDVLNEVEPLRHLPPESAIRCVKAGRASTGISISQADIAFTVNFTPGKIE